MKALALVGKCAFRLEEIPVPEIGPDEVLIRVRACGICGSDVHGMDGRTGRRIPPIIMGHEAAGDIADVGAEVSGWKTGDRVTFDSTVYCGECAYCRSGQPNLCDHRQVLGVSCADYRREGAMAEYVRVPARGLYRLPDDLAYHHAALAEPLAVALHAVARAESEPDQYGVVIGTGMIGLLVIRALAARGSRRITVVEPDADRRELARAFGASDAMEDASGLEADFAIEAVGLSATVAMAARSVRKGGVVSLVGNVSPDVSLPLQTVVTREIRLSGCCAVADEYPAAIAMLASGQVDTDRYITETVDLSTAADAFARLYNRTPGMLKVMICP